MRRTLLAAALLALACGTNVANAPQGEFTAPGGLAATGAGDRDLLFIANSGRDGLRALQLCTGALLPDGGVNPADTCPSNQNGQFIPAPIRVFPATIETGDRPLRVAGVRLSAPDGGAAGVALAAGGDSTVAVVDARSLVEAQKDTAVVPRPIQHLDVGSRAIDVVAANPTDDRDLEVAPDAGVNVPAFVATESELIVLDVGLDSAGAAQLPAIRGRCTLAPVLPTKIAVAPGDPGVVYVADGAGDGVVAIAASSVTSGACTMDRISAGGRSVRSVSASPKWYEPVTDVNGNVTTMDHPAGEMLLLVVDPVATAQAGQELDPGGLLIAQTGINGTPKGIVPIPPFLFSDTASERMEPLALPNSGPPAIPATSGLLREVTFLRAVKPRQTAPVAPDLKVCTAPPCTPLYVGQPATAPSHLFSLLAAVSSTDGASYFVDVLNRRFVNLNLYAATDDAAILPIIAQAPAFSPAVSTPPVLALDPLSLEPGVTHTTVWRALWHSPIPGLDRRGGVLSPTGTGTLRFTTPEVDFSVWQNDPAIRLAAGDVVSFNAFYLGADGSAACQAVVAEPAFRFELPIVSIAAGALELAELADTPDLRGFHPDGCSSVGAVAEVRTAGAQPWLVFEGNTVQGRVQPDGTFVARQRRFDYPRSAYAGGSTPQAGAANDIALRFAITGPSPTTPRSGFTWSMSSGQSYIGFSDSIAVGGFATAIYAYSSPRTQSLVFTSVTGSNEVLQADPSLLTSNISLGILAYR